jgi:hypothetical protein
MVSFRPSSRFDLGFPAELSRQRDVGLTLPRIVLRQGLEQSFDEPPTNVS